MKKIKKIWALLLIAALSVSILAGCGKKKEDNNSNVKLDPDNLVSANVDDKYGSCYQVFIYSFCDSDGDGIGDFNGLTSKLDYIKDLGFDSIWLLPFHKSPTYHKYDVIDYYSIDEEYGTMEDFDKFIAACKEKKSGAHLCGAVSGSARYYFDHCGGGVDAVRKCGEHRRDLCCYCDECGAWNGTVPQGGKIVGFAESTVVASCKGAS